MRVYVVGDIHGHVGLLDALHTRIYADLDQSPVKTAEIIYVGDYVDRGPASCAVVERLRCPPRDGVRRTLLEGNHETMLLEFLSRPETGASWCRYGGTETLLSYGVNVSQALAGGGLHALAEEFDRKLPASHRYLLEQLKPFTAVGDYFFCHAGVRPGVRLDRQDKRDLLWIRTPFLGSTRDFGKVVVHGHTVVPEPDIRPNRINVDTGAYRSGRLTCLVLEGAEQRFLYAATVDAV
jgi:serine/threonine protein phosphatase 1